MINSLRLLFFLRSSFIYPYVYAPPRAGPPRASPRASPDTSELTYSSKGSLTVSFSGTAKWYAKLHGLGLFCRLFLCFCYVCLRLVGLLLYFSSYKYNFPRLFQCIVPFAHVYTCAIGVVVLFFQGVFTCHPRLHMSSLLCFSYYNNNCAFSFSLVATGFS